MKKSEFELIFYNVFTAVRDAMDERRAADEIHLETMAHKTFDDYKEARIGDLITTSFQSHSLITSSFSSAFSNLQSKPLLIVNNMSH